MAVEITYTSTTPHWPLRTEWGSTHKIDPNCFRGKERRSNLTSTFPSPTPWLSRETWRKSRMTYWRCFSRRKKSSRRRSKVTLNLWESVKCRWLILGPNMKVSKVGHKLARAGDLDRSQIQIWSAEVWTSLPFFHQSKKEEGRSSPHHRYSPHRIEAQRSWAAKSLQRGLRIEGRWCREQPRRDRYQWHQIGNG